MASARLSVRLAVYPVALVLLAWGGWALWRTWSDQRATAAALAAGDRARDEEFARQWDKLQVQREIDALEDAQEQAARARREREAEGSRERRDRLMREAREP